MTFGGPDPNQPPNQPPPQWGQQPYPGQQPPPQQSYPGQQPYGQQPYPSAPPPAYGSPVPLGGTQPADLLIRIAARLLDGLILLVPLAIVLFIFGLLLGRFGSALGQIIITAVGIGYFAYFESTRGQTLGKQILSLRVVGPTGGNPTLEQSLKRNFFMAISLVGVITPFLGAISFLFSLIQLGVYIWIIVTIAQSPTKQGFHDKFAGDFHVVKTA